MSVEQETLIADLQAQVIALRMATEGTWLSLLRLDADPVAAAKRLGAENVTAVEQMPTDTDLAKAMKAAVAHHTERLWGSIAWQLSEAPPR